jgi:alcohol dehydrogenase
MKAAIYHGFKGHISIQSVAEPRISKSGAMLKVHACGICRSDWHGWMGNDPDIKLPHVPGHELAGEIVEIGSEVETFSVGDRVTLPFVCGCGYCEQCQLGNQQICDNQFQPGFTAWGGFAEYVAVEYADANLVVLPDEIDFVTASSLGCRFSTSFRAIVDQGKVAEGQWVSIYGCGGVGLSAVMIAAALGARVIAVDINDESLDFARRLGAEVTINTSYQNPVSTIIEITRGGVHVSVDALGNPVVVHNSISGLRKRGKHIQVGIMESGSHQTAVPIDKIIGRELEVIGSHGMQAHRYPQMLEMIKTGRLDPCSLVSKCIPLEDSPQELAGLNDFKTLGITVINDF